MTGILEVRSLAKSFDGVRAVDNVSFDLGESRLLAMIGPNGAGKSTCSKLINGQLRPDQGTIKILGRDTTGMQPRDVWSLGIGRAFQVTSTFSSMTVLQNIQTVMASRHKRTRSIFSKISNLFVDDAMELLKLVGIEGHWNRSCGILAYGELKRVERAVALANEPKLLLMDEPTAGMDPKEHLKLIKLTSEIVRTRSIGVPLS